MTTAIASLTDAHRAYLHTAAITDAVIDASGIHSVPEGIVFPWRDGTGTEVRQLRPDNPINPDMKYVWPKGQSPILNQVREHGDLGPVLLVEGTKQHHAVASWCPEGFSVYGMSGCFGWTSTDLSIFDGRDVYVLLDGDASSNANVYDAGVRLGKALDLEGALSVLFVQLPVQGKEGADDWLAKLGENRRSSMLAKLIARAAKKPADRKPSARGSGKPKQTVLPESDGRPRVTVNTDRWEAIQLIVNGLVERCDARSLFNFGGAITRLRDHTTVPLDRDSVYLTLAEHIDCYDYTPATETRPAVFRNAWPDGPTMGAVMASAEKFSRLDRVVRAPFVRPDGTVCDKPGYDKATRTAVVLGDGLDTVSVPEEPTQSDAIEAAKFLLDEWLGDMPFRTAADRANTLALALTPFCRGSFPLAPLVVVSGLQMGSGKNLLVECVTLAALGEPATPTQYTTGNDEEIRKQMTSLIKEGNDIIFFDEAHVIESAALARGLTAEIYTDRILGSTRMISLSNKVTWIAAGNQVQVNGDMSRRVCWIQLYPKGANPQDRDASCFRHPELKKWTRKNRGAIISAALTVIRAWYAAGRPRHSRGSELGSFEAWDRMMSGILHHAGVDGFMTDMVERRSESDFTTGYWAAHIAWLFEKFGGDTFTTKDVQMGAQTSQDFERPPGKDMEAIDAPNWTRALGQAYAKVQDRWFGSLRLHKDGTGHRNTIRWCVQATTPPAGPDDGNGADPAVGPEDSGPVGSGPEPDDRNEEGIDMDNDTTLAQDTDDTGQAQPAAPVFIPRQADPEASVAQQRGAVTGALGFDIETPDADLLYVGEYDGPYVRLAGGIGEAGDGVTTTDVSALLADMGAAEMVYGHRIFRFDLPALARHCGADYDALAAKAVDTQIREQLIDPPTAKGMKAGYYSLDAVAQRRGLIGKTDDLKALADEFGGYDKIPTDDARYVAYLHGDLKATRAVYADQAKDLARLGLEEYAAREMRVAAIQNRMSLNGFRVDTELLAQRVEAEETKRREALQALHSDYGVPLHREVMRGRGKARTAVLEPMLSPLSTKEGRAALIAAFKAAGAPFYPMTPSGDLALSAEALGDGHYFRGRDKLPGMLRYYRDNVEIARIVELVRTVTGATAKYAEIAKYVTSDGRVHGGIGEDQASGRWAMTRPSLTNLGKRGGKVEQRAVFLPEVGHVFLAADFSQVDMRAVAGHCQDPGYMALFEPGRDAHMDMADVYFGERTKENRNRTKAINHGLNYGEGDRKISDQYDIPLALVQQARATREQAYPKLIEWTNEVRAKGEAGELLDNGFGRLMRCDPQRAYTQAPALMGQGTARDIMTEGLLRMVERMPDVTSMFRAVVHDEVVLSVPVEREAEARQVLADAMTFEWQGVPILAEVSPAGSNWAACYAGE